MSNRVKPRNPLAEGFANRTSSRPATHRPKKGAGSYRRDKGRGDGE